SGSPSTFLRASRPSGRCSRRCCSSRTLRPRRPRSTYPAKPSSSWKLPEALFGLAHRCDERFARLVAATAIVGAETAVLVVRGMPLAFLAARATRGRTRFECHAEHTEIGLCLPRQRTAHRVAEIAAVQ